MKTSRMLVAALLVVAAGCGDGTGPFGINGTLSFSHSGATTGTFNASGSVLVINPDAATWAAGARDEATQSIAIAANVAQSGSTFDNVVIDFPQVDAGTVAIGAGANNANVAISFDMTASGSAAWVCGLTSGSVVVSSVSGSRVRGSFSGSGTCLPNGGAPVAFAVSNGSFDVPLLDVNLAQ
jgi:hypothetical protein